MDQNDFTNDSEIVATEYQVTLEEIAKFEEALIAARADAPNLHPIQARAMLSALESQLAELKEAAEQYRHAGLDR